MIGPLSSAATFGGVPSWDDPQKEESHMDDLCNDAELYALGMLERAHGDRIDEHVRTCDACARSLGQAEGAVTALVARVEQRRSAKASSWNLRSWPIAAA